MSKFSRKKLIVSIPLITAFAVMSYAAQAAHYHNYVKISETKDTYGDVTCTWECRTFAGDEHYKVTKGYSYCPNP